MVTASASAAVAPAPEELAQKDEWVGQNLLAEKGGLLFSFTYDGKGSGELLPVWERKTAKAELDANRTEHVLTWTDAKTGLDVRCRAVEYSDFPVVEWTVYFKNAGKADTSILADIQGLDVSFRREEKEPFVLRTIRGDTTGSSAYEPIVVNLGNGAQHRSTPYQGKSSAGSAFPYFNIEWDGRGVMAVLGWPGQWAARFECDKQQNLRIVGGQQLTRLKLLPGEEIRTPLVTLVFWKGGDWIRAQNLWRRWYMAHVMPRVNGKTPDPMAQMQVEYNLGGAENEMYKILSAAKKAGIKLDLCWLDAGWYPLNGSWRDTGTWEIDTRRYPNGFKPFTDLIHTQGMKFVLWFEPERVGWPGSWLAQNHPDWLLGGEGGTLLNLGNPQALAWAIEHFDAMIKSQGVDVYRQDFNMGPLDNWRKNDASDRQGMTENLHVQGYLAYWDSLLARNPGLLIDSCATGGGRNDLESMRRAVPLWRSDCNTDIEANQGFTYGLSSWLPYYGTWGSSREKYKLRSVYTTCFGFGKESGDGDSSVVNAYAECRKIAPCMLGDYYPLTTFAGPTDLTAWMAWQFDRPEQDDGVVQVFRRAKAKDEDMQFKLRGMDPNAVYELTDLDKTGTAKTPGRELMETGLPVKLPAPGSAVILYNRVKTLSVGDAHQ
jgi:alpha-galactosidase